MKIAYVSPMPPDKSGIADYSFAVVEELRKKSTVDVFTSKQAVTREQLYKPYNELQNLHKEYDYIIYHMGNNYDFHSEIYDLSVQISGFVVLHELSIHDFFITKYVVENQDKNAYISEMRNQYGEIGEGIAKKAVSNNGFEFWNTDKILDYPMINDLLNKSKGIFVHSEYVKQKIKEINCEIPVFKIPFPIYEFDMKNRKEKNDIKTEFGLSGYIVIGIFGYMTPAKRHKSIFEAMSQLSENQKKQIKVLLVGNSVDNYDIEKMIHEYELGEQVEVRKNVEFSEFKKMMKSCDFSINLRYPTNGETSASLFQFLGFGIPSIVTDIGSFSEMPDDYIEKICVSDEVEMLRKVLIKWIDKPAVSRKIGEKMFGYVVDNHSLEITAGCYLNAFTDYETGIIYGQEVELNSDSLNRLIKGMKELDVYNDDLTDLLAEKFKGVF